MKLLDYLGSALAAMIWTVIAIVYVLSVPVVFVIAVVVFPFWWIGEQIARRKEATS